VGHGGVARGAACLPHPSPRFWVPYRCLHELHSGAVQRGRGVRVQCLSCRVVWGDLRSDHVRLLRPLCRGEVWHKWRYGCRACHHHGASVCMCGPVWHSVALCGTLCAFGAHSVMLGCTPVVGHFAVCPPHSVHDTHTATSIDCSGACEPGKFSSGGATSSTCPGTCSAGYACPAGSTSATQVICPAGQFSLAGAASCSPCNLGAYGASDGQTAASCTGLCPAGRRPVVVVAQLAVTAQQPTAGSVASDSHAWSLCSIELPVTVV
jgi:hypothetical protein